MMESEASHLRCRMYEGEFPSTDEIVMVNVTEIGDMGAYVTLLEYDNKQVGCTPTPHLIMMCIYSCYYYCRV